MFDGLPSDIPLPEVKLADLWNEQDGHQGAQACCPCSKVELVLVTDLAEHDVSSQGAQLQQRKGRWLSSGQVAS